jgi:hypothetical protein
VDDGAAAISTPAAAPSGSWAPAWSWRSGSGDLPKGCAPYSGSTSAGMRWSAAMARIVQGRLRLAAAGGTTQDDLAGSGVGCTGRAQRYGRLEVRARMPQGDGLVGRIALWPSTVSHGSDWSGLTVPSDGASPAYATNGCGDETYGAALSAGLAGAFHDYLVTWSPHGFSLEVDGRTLYQDDESFDRPRWLGISLSASGPTAGSGQLLVEKMVAYSWTGPVPAATTGSADAGATVPAAGGQDSPGPISPAQDAAAPAVSGGPDGTSGGGNTAGGPGTANPGTAGTAALAVGGDHALDAVLGRARPSRLWLVGGGFVALGVLLGVVRAAHAARRRPLAPR